MAAPQTPALGELDVAPRRLGLGNAAATAAAAIGQLGSWQAQPIEEGLELFWLVDADAGAVITAELAARDEDRKFAWNFSNRARTRAHLLAGAPCSCPCRCAGSGVACEHEWCALGEIAVVAELTRVREAPDVAALEGYAVDADIPWSLKCTRLAPAPAQAEASVPPLAQSSP